MTWTHDTDSEVLRKHLADLLEWGAAHLAIEIVLRSFPAAHAGTQAGAIHHTAWEIIEHMRIAQQDVIRVLHVPGHVSPSWPDGFWPKTRFPSDTGQWAISVESFLVDLSAVRASVCDPKLDLYAASPRGTGDTVLREILFLADHNVYHVGQLVVLRQAIER